VSFGVLSENRTRRIGMLVCVYKEGEEGEIENNRARRMGRN
jgi:hypothetical protein